MSIYESSQDGALIQSQTYTITEQQPQQNDRSMLSPEIPGENPEDPFINNDKPYATATILSSGINIINSNIGAGILGLAYGTSEAGWLMGIVLLAAFAIINATAFNLLMTIGRTYQKNKSSYALVCKQTVPWLQIWIDIIIVFGWFLSLAAYLIIIGDYMPKVAEYFGATGILADRKLWIIIMEVVLIIPTTMLKKLSALYYTSFVAVFCFACFIVLVFLYLPQIPSGLDVDESGKGNINMLPPNPLSFFRAAPLFIFAYGGHPLAFTLTNELRDNTLQRIFYTIGWSFTTIAFVYSSVALMGYFTFGDQVEANLLKNYPNKGPIIAVRFMMSVAIAFSYPVIANAWKDSFAAIVFKTYKTGKDAKDLPPLKYYSIIVTVIVTTTITAMLTDNLAVILKFAGATQATFLQIILPGILYLYASSRLPTRELVDAPLHTCKKIISIFLIVIGSIIIPFGVALIWI